VDRVKQGHPHRYLNWPIPNWQAARASGKLLLNPLKANVQSPTVSLDPILGEVEEQHGKRNRTTLVPVDRFSLYRDPCRDRLLEIDAEDGTRVEVEQMPSLLPRMMSSPYCLKLPDGPPPHSQALPGSSHLCAPRLIR